MAELRNNKRKGTKAVGPSKRSREQKKKRLSDDFAWPTSHLRPALHWFTVRSTPSRFIVDSCLHLGALELALRVCCSSEIVCQNFPKLNYCSKVRLENAEKEKKKSFFPLAPSLPSPAFASTIAPWHSLTLTSHNVQTSDAVASFWHSTKWLTLWCKVWALVWGLCVRTAAPYASSFRPPPFLLSHTTPSSAVRNVPIATFTCEAIYRQHSSDFIHKFGPTDHKYEKALACAIFQGIDPSESAQPFTSLLSTAREIFRSLSLPSFPAAFPRRPAVHPTGNWCAVSSYLGWFGVQWLSERREGRRKDRVRHWEERRRREGEKAREKQKANSKTTQVLNF